MMQKGEAKSEQPSVMSSMTPPQEPGHKTSGQSGAPSPPSVRVCTGAVTGWYRGQPLAAVPGTRQGAHHLTRTVQSAQFHCCSAEPCQDFEAFACGRREPPPKLRSFDTLLKHHWHVLDVNLMVTRGLRKPPRFAATRKAVAMLLACLHQGSLDNRRRGRQ
ncbi:hypothetical protein MRX96_049769, partial [Rhipicephalus microplus]